jgi:nitroreductase
MRARIEEMLPLAVTAPSGDNSQPWIFSFPTDDILRITNVPGKDIMGKVFLVTLEKLCGEEESNFIG